MKSQNKRRIASNCMDSCQCSDIDGSRSGACAHALTLQIVELTVFPVTREREEKDRVGKSHPVSYDR